MTAKSETIELRETMTAERKLAYQAMGLLIISSKKNPASVTGQSARIAASCRIHGLNPTDLGESLLRNPDIVSEAMRRGDALHAANGIQPIRLLFLGIIINSDFGFAKDLLALDNSELEELYESSQGKPITKRKEKKLFDKANKMIALKAVQREYMKDQ